MSFSSYHTTTTNSDNSSSSTNAGRSKSSKSCTSLPPYPFDADDVMSASSSTHSTRNTNTLNSSDLNAARKTIYEEMLLMEQEEGRGTGGQRGEEKEREKAVVGVGSKHPRETSKDENNGNDNVGEDDGENETTGENEKKGDNQLSLPSSSSSYSSYASLRSYFSSRPQLLSSSSPSSAFSSLLSSSPRPLPEPLASAIASEYLRSCAIRRAIWHDVVAARGAPTDSRSTTTATSITPTADNHHYQQYLLRQRNHLKRALEDVQAERIVLALMKQRGSPPSLP